MQRQMAISKAQGRPEAERALKQLASFRECAKDCPEMIVVRAGGFRMGSPATEKRPLCR